jgi:DNA-binding MarR family transcriptional regulator
MIESKYILPERIKLKTVKNKDLRKFCVMPLKAVLNKNITGENLRVLAVLASYANKGGYSFVSLKTIANDLKCSAMNIHKHLKRLENAGAIISYKNYFPGLKGNTRRIIYDEKIKDEDLKEHQYTNADISEVLKHNKIINTLNREDKLDKDYQSAISDEDDIASLFNTITKESDLILAERLLAEGLTPKEVLTRMALSS